MYPVSEAFLRAVQENTRRYYWTGKITTKGGAVYALVVFVAVDYVTGLMAAAVEKKLSSGVGFRGIFKKIVVFCLVALGHILDTHIIQNGSAVRTAVIFFYLSNEGISILENAARIGLPVPEKLKGVLAQLREEKGKE